MTIQYLHPKVGQKVRVTYRTRDIYFKAKSEFTNEWVDGIVLPNHKFVNPNAFVLRVNCQLAPVREIDLKNVIDLQYFDGTEATTNEVDNEVKTIVVKGSKGDEYTIVKTGNNTTCTCVGFQYRKACKHLEMIK